MVNYEKKTDVPESRHQGRSDWRARGPGTGGREAVRNHGARPGARCSSTGIGEAGDGWCGRSVMELDRRLVSCVSGFGGLGAATADVVERHLGG